jgi:hypothetical protein
VTEVQLAGIKALIKDWCGLTINLVNGGPSVADPIGEYAHYISFRDSSNYAIAIGVNCEGHIVLLPRQEVGKRVS